MVALAQNSSSTIQPVNIMRARFGNGRLTYPVKPNQALYAQFEHVAGLPSSSEGGGLSLSKLRSIDILLDRLVHLKKTAGTSEQRAAIDRMIQELESKARSPRADLGRTVQHHANELSSLANGTATVNGATVKGGANYVPKDVFQGLLFSISA